MIDDIQDNRINPHLIDQAKLIKNKLLSSVHDEYLCHGDLHLANIIQTEQLWVAIDPKGIMGEKAFEVAAFDLLDKEELNESSIAIHSKIIERSHRLSVILNLDVSRLLSWFYLRVIISAQWLIEDQADPSFMLDLAQHLHPILKEVLDHQLILLSLFSDKYQCHIKNILFKKLPF